MREKIGKKIQELREKKEVSIEQLANMADVDRNFLSAVEKGRRIFSIDFFQKVLEALDTDFAQFFNDENFEKGR